MIAARQQIAKTSSLVVLGGRVAALIVCTFFLLRFD
jgi:hypothetical protein